MIKTGRNEKKERGIKRNWVKNLSKCDKNRKEGKSKKEGKN